MDYRSNDLKLKIAYELSKENVGAKYLRKLLKSDWQPDNVETEFIAKLKENDIHIIGEWEKEYPEYLKNIDYPPLLLFARGNIELLKYRMITIVGSRHNTVYGKNVIRDLLGKEFSKLNYATVSGLANGIDYLVHKRSIEIKTPTVAVLPAAIDQAVPTSNKDIYDSILLSGGLIISEFPPMRKHFKGMFPMRNRILAGLSKFILIVEAGDKSGSLITAKYGLDYGIEVMAVPGSIFSASSYGCNKLISEGAGMITSAQEFLTQIKDLSNIELTKG